MTEAPGHAISASARSAVAAPTRGRTPAHADAAPVFRLGLLALDGTMLSSLSGPADALHVAQILLELRSPNGAPRLEAVMFSARGSTQIRTATGSVLGGIKPLVPEDRFDFVLIPGMDHRRPREILDRRSDFAPELAAIRDFHLRGTRIGATCSGTYLLAMTGLLDGRRATTAWWMANSFRRHFPDVRLEEQSLIVDEGDVVTTGASTAVFTLVLRLLGQHVGEELAQQTARMMLLDSERQSQAPYVSQALLEKPRHSMTEKISRFLERELHNEISVSRLASHCGTSERSLLRHFRQHYGTSPLGYIQHLRVERAKALLEATQLSFDEVVERCGYSDVPSFRKLFKRETSLTPADYRERFRLRAR
jgi:transcriptional regulator GlxA family with amidase domain